MTMHTWPRPIHALAQLAAGLAAGALGACSDDSAGKVASDAAVAAETTASDDASDATTQAEATGGDTAVTTTTPDTTTAETTVSDTTPIATTTPTAPDTSTTETSPATTALVINEMVCASATGGADWFELYVAGAGPVRLSDFTIVDDNAAHTAAALPDVTLQPGAFYVVTAATEAPASGDPWVPFGLGSGDALTLATVSGTVVDTLAWHAGDAPEGASWGRLPDGSLTLGMLAPTPGAANQALSAPLATDPFPQDRVIPVVVEMTTADWQALIATAREEIDYPATVTYNGVRVSDVMIRTKGNSSLNAVAGSTSHRFSFKIDINDVLPDQRLLGLKKLVFNNGFKDPTLIREALAYGIMRDFGVPTPRTAFVDLTVAGEHLGLYTVVEAIDGDFIDRWFDNKDGDLLKPEMPDGDLRWEDANASSYVGVALETNTDTSDMSSFIHLLDVLNHGTASDYATVLDTEEILRVTAINALLVNLDSYLGMGHNYYLYDNGGLFAMIPWDANEAFGNFNCNCSKDGLIAFAMDAPTCGVATQKPLVAKLLAVPALRDRYHAIIGELLDGLFSESQMAARIDAAADLIRPYVIADTTKFYSTEAFETGLVSDSTSTGPGSNGTSFGLASFVTKRGAAVRTQLGTTSTATQGCTGGTGPGNPGGPKCPDGICDAAEQQNPQLCPADCD